MLDSVFRLLDKVKQLVLWDKTLQLAATRDQIAMFEGRRFAVERTFEPRLVWWESSARQAGPAEIRNGIPHHRDRLPTIAKGLAECKILIGT